MNTAPASSSLTSKQLGKLATANAPTVEESHAMLKAFRHDHGMTKGAIAFALGLPFGSIHQWLLGRKPSTAARQRIGEVFRSLSPG